MSWLWLKRRERPLPGAAGPSSQSWTTKPEIELVPFTYGGITTVKAMPVRRNRAR